MKRILVLMILILSISLPAALAVTAFPKFVAADSIDLGKFKAGLVFERLVTLENQGQADLVIQTITSNCPCSSFLVPDNEGIYQPIQNGSQITIPPGEKLALKIHFNSNNTTYRGEFLRTIVINSNDPDEPTKLLSVTGEIYE